MLIGREPTDESIAEAASAVEGVITPLTDVHATAEYKRHLAQVTTRRALRLARDRAMGAA